jgi:SPP1 family predicted phage head-tail adaptor
VTTQPAGKLRYRGTLQRRTESVGALGQSKNDWIDVCRRWASIEPLRGRELERARQVISTATTRIIIRAPRTFDLTSKYRFIFQDTVYNAASVREIGERLEDIEMICETA